MAAAEHDWGSVVRGGRLQRGWEWGQGVAGLPRVAVGSRRWPPAEEAKRERGGRHRLDLFAISEKFRGRTVKQK